MALPTFDTEKDYTLGRYKMLFDRFADGVTPDSNTEGEGYVYLGNSPAIGLTSTSEDLEHFDADEGVNVKDASVQLSLDRAGTFELDNINIYNLALQFLGEADAEVAQSADASEVELITVKRGRSYQLGATEANPSGRRLTTITTVKSGSPGFATTVAASGNYQHSTETGLLYIEPDSPDIDDDMILEVTYATAAGTRAQVISGSTAIYGQLKLISTNPRGTQRDIYLPYVKLAPDGDFALKGDDWQKLPFSYEILKRGNLEAVYVDGRAVAA